MRAEGSQRRTRYLIRHKPSGKYFAPTNTGALLTSRREVTRLQDWFFTAAEADYRRSTFAQAGDYETIPITVFQRTAERI